MEVSIIPDTDRLDYDWLSRDNFFGSPAWLAAQGKKCIRFGIYRNSELFGAFFLYQYTRLGKQFLINLPMAPHCGLKLRLMGEKVHSRQSEVKRAITAIATFLRQEYKGAIIDFTLPIEFLDAQPFQWRSYQVIPKYTYLLQVDKGEDHLLKQMSTPCRKNIRAALAASYELRKDAPVDTVLEIIGSSLKRAGQTFHGNALRYLLENDHEEVVAYTVYKDEQPLAVAVAAHHGAYCYYLAGGHIAEQGDGIAGTLALWSAISESYLWGCTTFDFLGSSVPTIEKYFRGFGAELTPYFRIQYERGLISWVKKQREKYHGKG